MTDWLSITPGDAPLIVSIPHAGTIIPDDISGLLSDDLARRDADHHVHLLYAFAAELGATIIHSRISRTVIDLNRDPSGQSLYPGQATTGLCSDVTFDGEPLYLAGSEPDEEEIERRRAAYFDPYHAALREQISDCAHCTRRLSSMTGIRSAAMCRACSKANCRSSTSAAIMG